MKATVTNYKDNDVHSVGHYKTKKEAKIAKRNFLRMWTVREKVKYNIQSVIN